MVARKNPEGQVLPTEAATCTAECALVVPSGFLFLP